MDATLKLILTIVCAVFALAGLVVVYAAPAIVDRRGLAAKRKVDPRIAENLPPDQVERYKRDGAILDMKLVGVAVAVPMLLLIVFALR